VTARRAPLCVRRTYRDDSLQAVLDRQPSREPNRRIDNDRTAEAMLGRARWIPGETPAQVVARLEAMAAKVRS
jgi:hypothetical protein